MRRIAEQALDTAKSLGASYADVRVIEQHTESIETKDLNVAAVNMGSTLGLGIRVLLDGGWGFASTQDLSKKGIDACVSIACATGKASASCLEKPITWAFEPVHEASWNSPCQIDPFTISLETKTGILLDAAKIMLAVKGVTLTRGMMVFIKEKKYYANSEGSRIEQTFVKTGSGIEAYATKDNERQRRSYPNSMGGQQQLAGFEAVTRFDLPGNAERIANEVVALLSAPSCPQGKLDVILGSSQLGLQIHESTGHPSELDRALGWEINFAGASFLTPDKLGKLQYGSAIVNLVADATAPGALGSFGFDDDGVAAQKTYLVKDGIFSGYLSSRDTVHLIGQSRSAGCMRAQSWSSQPIIRMTNISLEPGNAGSLEDLIADTDRGILFETNKSWSIDQLRYNFQFSTEIAWEIEKGKRKRILKNASYGGITPQFWNSCDAICDKGEYIEWGLPNCGKGQPMQTMWTGHGASPADSSKWMWGWLMLSKDYCQTLIDQVIAYGKGLVDGIEVHVYGSNIATSRFANNSMTQNQSPSQIQVAVRVIKDSRQARLSTEDLSVEGLQQVVKNATRIASLLQPDKDLPSLFAGNDDRKEIVELLRYITETAELSPADRAKNVKDMISVGWENKLNAAGTYASGEFAIALGNSNGVFAYHQESSAETSVTMVAPDSTGWAKAHATDANYFDASVLAHKAAEKALHSACPHDIEPGSYTVILEPSATLDLLGYLWPDFAATSHMDKLSCLLDKVGQKVFGDNVTVYDDASHPLQSGPAFDGEGVTRERVCLIDKGVVKDLVYGRRAALKLRAKPTGHGLGEPNPMGEMPNNIVMLGGTKSVDELIASTDQAILLTRVWYVREVDPATKIITGMTRDGTFLVKDGKIAHGVKNLRFNVSIIDMLNNIVELGETVRAAGEEANPAVVPALKVNNFHFSSGTKF